MSHRAYCGKHEAIQTTDIPKFGEFWTSVFICSQRICRSQDLHLYKDITIKLTSHHVTMLSVNTKKTMCMMLQFKFKRIVVGEFFPAFLLDGQELTYTCV